MNPISKTATGNLHQISEQADATARSVPGGEQSQAASETAASFHGEQTFVLGDKPRPNLSALKEVGTQHGYQISGYQGAGGAPFRARSLAAQAVTAAKERRRAR